MPIWTVEYSVKEDAYKMRTFDKMIEENNLLTQRGEDNAYSLIGISVSVKEARKLADLHAKILPEKILNL